jgi:hypothetical protein
MKRLTFLCLVLFSSVLLANSADDQFTSDFQLRDCRFSSTGANRFFNLRPGGRLVLEAEQDDETERLVITVLHDTVGIFVPSVGVVRARVVEERETVGDELVEVSRNFFAICRQTGDVFYFGEEVDIYQEDGSVTHDGAWRAGWPDGDGVAHAGIIMPGRFLLGARYFQEMAEGVAMDRAEHVEMGLTVSTPAGTFRGCVRIVETTPLDPDEESEKIYCPGIGLTVDADLRLVSYRFEDDDDDNDD